MDLREVFAANLRRLRHAKGLSQDDLAYEAEVSRSYLSQIETAKHHVSLLMTPLIYQTAPKTSANSGWSCSIREKRCISGSSLASGMVGMRS